MTNETTASEREAFDQFAAANAGTLFTGTVTANQAPFYMAIWSAACRWQAARAALPAPADQVLVPKRLTRAMREVLEEEGWTWEDLLAAAEAITEAEHTELQAVHGASDSNEQDQQKPRKLVAVIESNASISEFWADPAHEEKDHP